MSAPRWRGLVLLLIQVALVSTIAAKYGIDRATLPRIWVRTVQYDPEQPLRGRYLALRVMVDGCSLRPEDGAPSYDFRTPRSRGSKLLSWQVTLLARSGVLTAERKDRAAPEGSRSVEMASGDDCHRARLGDTLDYFVPEHAVSSFPLKAGSELWVEVTVPKTGPPRPIQLAVSGPGGFRVLDLH